MARTRRDEPDEYGPDEYGPDDWDESDEYDAEHDYDPEDPETYPQGLYADDGPPTVPCPHCRAEVFEDSEVCPRCGKYLAREDAPAQSRGGAWVIVMILALLAVAMWVAGR